MNKTHRLQGKITFAVSPGFFKMCSVELVPASVKSWVDPPAIVGTVNGYKWCRHVRGSGQHSVLIFA